MSAASVGPANDAADPPVIQAFHTVHWSPMFGAHERLEEIVAATSAAGFTHLGLDVATVDAYVSDGHSLADVRRLFDTWELRCSDVLPIVVTSHADEVRERTEQLCRVVRVMEAPRCVLAVRAGVDVRMARPEIQRAAATVRDAGARAALEFARYTGVESMHDAVELCEAAGWETLGLVLDVLHVDRCGVIDDISQLAPEQIELVQFCDGEAGEPTDLVADSRQHRKVPGGGGLDLARFVANIRSTGYCGTVAAEVLSTEVRAATPDEIAPRMRTALAAYWGGTS
jgi:sugar phosphate isomerase/epimerase